MHIAKTVSWRGILAQCTMEKVILMRVGKSVINLCKLINVADEDDKKKKQNNPII